MLIVHVCSLWYSHFISILCNLYKKLCIKLVSTKEMPLLVSVRIYNHLQGAHEQYFMPLMLMSPLKMVINVDQNK